MRDTVLFCSHTSQVSGAEISLLTLLNALSTSRWRPVLACPKGELSRRAEAGGIPVLATRSWTAGYGKAPHSAVNLVATLLPAQLDIIHAVLASRPSIVHANSTRAAILCAPACLMTGTPLMVHVRDKPVANIVDACLRKCISRLATRVIAISSFVASGFESGMRAGKVVVVHNAVDVARFDPERVSAARVRAELRLAGCHPVLGVFGQITPWKGQLSAVEALAEVRRTFPTAKLLIVGAAKFLSVSARYDNAAYLEALYVRAQQLGVQGDVLWLGERDDIPELMAACDCVLVPSWDEPFGRVIIEAMALEKPVVATRGGGTGEIIEDGVTGWLVPRGDGHALAAAAMQLASDKGQAMACGQAGRAVVLDRFNPAAHVRAIESVYRSAR